MESLMESCKQKDPELYNLLISNGYRIEESNGQIWVIGDDFELTAELFLAISLTNQKLKGSEKLERLTDFQQQQIRRNPQYRH